MHSMAGYIYMKQLEKKRKLNEVEHQITVKRKEFERYERMAQTPATQNVVRALARELVSLGRDREELLRKAQKWV